MRIESTQPSQSSSSKTSSLSSSGVRLGGGRCDDNLGDDYFWGDVLKSNIFEGGGCIRRRRRRCTRDRVGNARQSKWAWLPDQHEAVVCRLGGRSGQACDLDINRICDNHVIDRALSGRFIKEVLNGVRVRMNQTLYNTWRHTLPEISDEVEAVEGADCKSTAML